MAVQGFFVCWPDMAATNLEARVARCHAGLQHRNAVALRPAKTFVYWASPILLVPAENWYLHAASVAGRDRQFDPSEEGGVMWEHFPIQADGLTAFQFSADRSYLFYITVEMASESDLKAHEMPWHVYVHQPEETPERVRILFPAQPLDSDQHGDDYAKDFDLRASIGTPLVFNSDEHLELADDAQKLVDLYALNGLIDGGALIRDTDKPVEEWDIVVPNPKGDPTKPYGNVAEFLSYHWHYIIPSSVFATTTARWAPGGSAQASDADEGPTFDRGMSLWTSGPTWTAKDLRAAIVKGEAAALSLGQILMMAGDFFQSLDEMKSGLVRDPVNVMKGVDARARFACMIVDVASLEHSRSWGSKELGKVEFMENVSKDAGAAEKAINWDKVKALAAALRQIRGKTMYSELHTLAHMIVNSKGQKLDEAERLLPWARKGVRAELLKVLTKKEVKNLDSNGFNDEIFNIGVTNGHYADLALENVPHFSPWNWQQFERYQNEAFQLIGQQMKSSDPKRHPIPADAVAHTAFGLHFLTDAFSSGHMRVPRAALGAEGALAAKLMHDIDGYYGLQVTDKFGNGWRAYGDGNLRKTTLDDPQQKILKSLKAKPAPNVSGDADTNWERAKAAVGAAFKQLHYHAQSYYSPPPVAMSREVADVQQVLGANRTPTRLMWDEYAKGKAAEEGSLAQALAVNIKGRLAFMEKYRPVPNAVGTDILQNHPPLFLDDGTLNTAAKAYSVDKPSFGNERVLVLRWHGNTGNTIKKDFSKYYYLAKFTAGASLEKWVDKDETRLVGVLDGLPKA